MSPLREILQITKHVILLIWCITTGNHALADAMDMAQEKVKEFSGICFFDIESESINVDDIITDGAITIIEIGNINKISAYIVNPNSIICGDENLGMCGSRGCPMAIFAENASYSYTGWQPIPINYGTQTLLLMPHSGWMCGGEHNGSPCFSVIAWDELNKTFNLVQSR